MKKIKAILTTSILLSATSGLFASVMIVNTPEKSTGYVGLTVAGENLENTGTEWNFGIGKFSANPVDTDWADWAGNFDAFNTVNWITNPPFSAGRLNSKFSMTDTSFTGEQGYIWGYNSQAVEAGSEWVLVTNSDWIFPEYDKYATAVKPGDTWSFTDAGTNFIVGTELDNGFQMQAIPEPSTYALIFGLGILGFLGFRRVRK